MVTRVASVLFAFLVACGMQRSSNSGPDVHGGVIDCHGVLVPTQKGFKKAIFLCGSARSACEASKAEQANKGLEVSDCAPHPFASCFPNGTGQLCLSTMRDCREFAEAVHRDPEQCTAYESDAPTSAFSGAFPGHYDTDWGWAVVLQRGSKLAVTYARGTMSCDIDGASLACAWNEKDKSGRARFAQQSDGAWVGTWGAGASESGGGAWTFHRTR